MRKISKPNISQKNICDSFKNLMYTDRILDVSSKYTDIIKAIEDFYNDELTFERNNQGYTDYMKKMYSQRFSNKQYTDSYNYYKEIRDLKSCCPYCNFHTRKPRQLDHYLPKSKFPSLAITVDNLVPICKDCNELKGDECSFKNSEKFIHPYYGIAIEDMFKFLRCKIIEEVDIGFNFYIEKLDKWDSNFFNNVNYHFEKLQINELYLSDFEADFDSFIGELQFAYDTEGYDDIWRSLNIKTTALLKGKKYPWKYAGYNALLNNKWFLDIYFPSKINGKI